MPTGNVFAADAGAPDGAAVDAGAVDSAGVGLGTVAGYFTGWVATRGATVSVRDVAAGAGGAEAAVDSADATAATESGAGPGRPFGAVVSAPSAPGA